MAGAGARLAAGAWLLWRVPVPRPAGGGRGPVAVVVPARDEAAALPELLPGLLAARRPGDEVVVVDDGSADGTADVAAGAGATVVAAPPPPDGWTGKAWACHTGVAATTAPVLVFLDADTRIASGGLDRVVAEHAAAGGLVSVQPYHLVPTAVERLSAVCNVVAMMGTDAFTPLGRRLAPIGAFGPVLVSTRADYATAGGHAAVAGAVLDDVALARRYRAAGLPVTCLGGRGTVSFRMYPGGLPALVEGWSKNLSGGAASTRPVTLVLVVAWVSLLVQAPWWLLTEPVPLGLAAYAAVAAELWWMLRRIGSFGPATAVAFPAPLAAFLAVFARSAVLRTVRRRVRWKGRDVPVRGRGT
ncbi:MAG TPA: glycosyltransferase family A protein [Acidimicrobiales bacterium]